MMPEAGGFIFSTESLTLINSKYKKGGCGEGISEKSEQVILWRSRAMGSLAVDGVFL